MGKKRRVHTEHDPVEGAALLRRVFPMLAQLADSGTERDRAGNRQLLFSQYAGLILVGLLNPVLQSARALVAASGLKNVRQLTGGKKVSLGAFSEAASVFEPALLERLVEELRSKARWQHHLQSLSAGGKPGELPDKLINRLVAVDGSVLNALPSIVGKLEDVRKGQWRLHAHVHVKSNTLIASKLTEESSAKGCGERVVMDQTVQARHVEVPDDQQGHLYLMDSGYRSAALFNTIRAKGHDYVCRLTRTDGRVVSSESDVLDQAGNAIELPPLSDTAQAMGIVADELITLGGGCGASKTGSDHPLRRITLIPVEDRPSSARQGRVRSDQGGRDELILATTLLDLPAEQIVELYEYRWQVELFFRFLKHVLKCNTLLSSKTKGVEIQLYCAIIASLLLALATGGNINKRQYEMICLYFAGWADEEELLEAIEKRPP